MVVVVILQTDSNSNRVCLESLFNNSYYNTVNVLPYTNNFDYRKALEYCSTTYPSEPCLLIQDTSVTNLTQSELVTAIQRSLVVTTDMIFLCKWTDMCQILKPVNQERICSSSLMWTINPTSIQAVIYTPGARDYMINAIISSTVDISNLINNQLASHQMKAITYTPNIIDFDITLVTENSDFLKLNECMPVNYVSSPGSNTATLIIFLIVMAVTIAVAWSILYLSRTWH